MDREQIVADLNEILSLEYTAVLQYTYESFVLKGMDRPRFLQMFRGEAAESLTHAQMVGDKIVALGGNPTAEVGRINTTTELHAMLKHNLSLERMAVELYSRALDHAQDDVALRVMLENQVQVEKTSVEELERILG
jgi:bacterioferritin